MCLSNCRPSQKHSITKNIPIYQGNLDIFYDIANFDLSTNDRSKRSTANRARHRTFFNQFSLFNEAFFFGPLYWVNFKLYVALLLSLDAKNANVFGMKSGGSRSRVYFYFDFFDPELRKRNPLIPANDRFCFRYFFFGSRPLLLFH